MTAVVRLALARPYTFVVMAILVMIFGALSAIRTPTTFFQISASRSSRSCGAIPACRRTTWPAIIAPYERTLSTTVNDIERIEAWSLPGVGVVKVFFAERERQRRSGPGHVDFPDDSEAASLGATPPIILVYNASSIPIIQLALSGNPLSQVELFDLAQNFIRPQLTTVAGAQIPYPYGGATRQVQIDLDQNALSPHNLSATDVGAALALQNQINPVGTEKIGP